MAGKLYVREQKDQIGFSVVDETGEAVLYVVDESGVCTYHPDYYSALGLYDNFEAAEKDMAILNYTVATKEDLRFFCFVKLAAHRGISVDEAEYVFPQVEEEAATSLSTEGFTSLAHTLMRRPNF